MQVFGNWAHSFYRDTLRVVLILMYSVPKLLMQMKMDSDFRLVRFINETAMTNLSKDHILLDNWKLNLRKLSQFLSTETFCKFTFTDLYIRNMLKTILLWELPLFLISYSMFTIAIKNVEKMHRKCIMHNRKIKNEILLTGQSLLGSSL